MAKRKTREHLLEEEQVILSEERTALSSIRTGLAFIGVGLVVITIVEDMLAQGISYILIGFGLIQMIQSYLTFRKKRKEKEKIEKKL